MKKHYINTSLVLATLSAMSAVAHSEELKKQSTELKVSGENKIQGLENLANKEYVNLSALKDKWNITDRIYKEELEQAFSKKLISLSIGQNVNAIVENYGTDKIAKTEIFENIILGQAVYGTNANSKDSTDLHSLLSSTPNSLGGVKTDPYSSSAVSTGSSCHFACHGACHSACHGSRGWR